MFLNHFKGFSDRFLVFFFNYFAIFCEHTHTYSDFTPQHAQCEKNFVKSSCGFMSVNEIIIARSRFNRLKNIYKNTFIEQH